MAEIQVERKGTGGLAWLWILLALVIVAIAVWLLWPDATEDVAGALRTEPAATATEPVTPAAPAVAGTGQVTLAAIHADPDAWVGREFEGEVTVAEVPGDRGFWVEQEGQRLFAILVDDPAEQPVDINAGQRLRIRASIHDAESLATLPGAPLDEATRSVASQQPAYLVVGETAIEIVDAQTS